MRLLAVEASQNGSHSRSRYQQAEGLGARLHVLNGLGEPGYWPEPRYRIVGSKKIGDIADAARSWHREVSFDGVLTFAESAIVSTAAVAEALGLPGIGLRAARISRNKILMHQAHQEAGALVARYRYAPELADGLAAAADFGYPVVIKPALGAASHFVFRADTERQFRRCYLAAQAGARSMTWAQMEADGIDLGPDGLVVESFLTGSEHLIEAFAWDGQVHVGSIVDRISNDMATFEDNVHQAPTGLRQDQIDQIQAALTAAVAGHGLCRSALHAEVRFHEGRPHVLEVTPRPGGGGLEHMAWASAGYRPIAAHVQISCGELPQAGGYAPTGVYTAARALLCEAGIIDEIIVPPAVSQSPELLFCRLMAAPGDRMLRPPEGNGIIGFLGATGASREDAMSNVIVLASQIQVRLTDLAGTFRRLGHMEWPETGGRSAWAYCQQVARPLT